MSFFSAFFSTAHAESAPEEPKEESAPVESKEESGEEAPPAEEEEEEEPEDTAPGIREACADSKACHSFKHHFEECAERINAGNKHIEGENCVEELFHLMHCVDDCAAPKVFATLK